MRTRATMYCDVDREASLEVRSRVSPRPMVAQRKNLLEAFKNAGDVPDLSGAAKPPPPPPPREPRERRPIKLPSLPSFAEEIPRGLLLAAGAGIIFALGVALGRASNKPTEAAEPDSDGEAYSEAMDLPSGPGIVPARDFRDLGTRDPAASDEGGESESLEDSPLFDAANRYTVVVATYTTQNPDPAWATYLHLRSEGFAVFPPVAKNEHLMILVGAAPRSRDLEDTEERIRRLRRGRSTPYDDAYRAPIDRYIER